MRTLKGRFLSVVALLALAGCSHQQWYYASRPALQERCMRHTVESQYRACLASVSLEYESYRRRVAGIDTPANLRD